MNLDVARHSDFLGQGQHKFDRNTGLELLLRPKIQSAKADVPSFAELFHWTRRLVQTKDERKRHRETPRGAAFARIGHCSPPQASEFSRKLASKRGTRNGTARVWPSLSEN